VPSPSQARIPQEVVAPAPPQPSKTMFSDTGWTAAKEGEGNTRMFAAMHLARLRMQAGIEDGTMDDLSLGQSIFEDPAVTDADIAIETATLAKVMQRREAGQARTTARSLVPTRATAVARTVPSLAPTGDEGLSTTAADSSISDDELGFME
jgi:hypothetical protein